MYFAHPEYSSGDGWGQHFDCELSNIRGNIVKPEMGTIRPAADEELCDTLNEKQHGRR